MTQTKIILALIVAIVLTGLLTWFGADYFELRRAAEQNEQRGQVIENTAGTIADGAVVDARQQEAEQVTAAAEPVYRTIYVEAKQNEPIVADRASRPVPDSVRRAYRERRLARERSARVQSQRASDAETANAAER